ncbi:MAG: SMC-Scp complex subunit ScpB [Blastocatellia bacterium]|nr:SMC-Scp complex subunit ScpB [Blastocatellia bacterium]
MNGENEPVNEEALVDAPAEETIEIDLSEVVEEAETAETISPEGEEVAGISIEEEPSVEIEDLFLDDDETESDDPDEVFAAEGDETDGERIRIVASDEALLLSMEGEGEAQAASEETEEIITASREELKPAIESILFVADEPLPFKQLCKILGDVNDADVQAALDELVAEYDSRNSGLEFREIAGGWRISTRPQNHEFIRKYLKSRPTARLSLPALETLAVIAYKQPITIPEILEIRGVTSSSAIKTLLEKRLIVTKGRKETVGRPMMYGTSKEFLIQFGLKDLSELPSIEDFEDLAQ